MKPCSAPCSIPLRKVRRTPYLPTLPKSVLAVRFRWKGCWTNSTRLNDAQWSPDGDFLVWSQSLDGKTSLFAKPAGDAAFDLSGELNPSGGVGYGGGDFFAGRQGVVFAERNGRMYFKPYGEGLPRPRRTRPSLWK